MPNFELMCQPDNLYASFDKSDVAFLGAQAGCCR